MGHQAGLRQGGAARDRRHAARHARVGFAIADPDITIAVGFANVEPDIEPDRVTVSVSARPGETAGLSEPRQSR